MSTPALLWFRRDLRLDDQPALLAAASQRRPVLGVFVVDHTLLTPAGGPRRTFLAASLAALDESIGGRLLIVRGRPESTVPRLAAEIGATEVHISADYGPYGRRRDARVAHALAGKEIDLVATGSPYAVAPGRIRKPGEQPYSVFTPYYRAWTRHGWREPAGPATGVDWLEPRGLPGKSLTAASLAGDSVGADLPEAGEPAALRTWRAFLERSLTAYDSHRDRPDLPGTSHMSVYLKWGTVHPRTLLADLAGHRGTGATSFRSELAWREFYADLLFHRPEAATVSVDPAIDGMHWDTGTTAARKLKAWKQGRTGVPIVDAGMRQLLAEGWMHNRVRMIVASFLIKDLHLPWQSGAAHFMEHLVDGDVASNSGGWQWVAGSGPQAAPFYRVFNPTLQGEKFDPDGDYVRRYVPELRSVPGKRVHQPWELPDGPPDGYLSPIVDHRVERDAALSAYAARPR